MANTLAEFLINLLNSQRYSKRTSLAGLGCKLLGIDESYLWRLFGRAPDANYASLLVALLENLLRHHPELKVLVRIPTAQLGVPAAASNAGVAGVACQDSALFWCALAVDQL